jgi:alkylhydroperoxidase family enzyme
MARITPPEGGISVFDYNPELWEKFNEFYGYLWTHGALDQPTKESARLRNARVTGCAICRNLRFDGAREQGLTEAYVEQIVDGYEQSTLPDRWKAAVGWTDTVIGFPADATDAQRDALAREFTRPELVELTFAAAISQGFSKAAVAWGPPEDIPITVVPTPAPGTTVTDGSTHAPAAAAG